MLAAAITAWSQLGRNDDLAWTMTTTLGDTQDLFVERVAPDDPASYLTPSGLSQERMKIVVYDLGGGTFDVTLVELAPGDFRADCPR